MAIFIGQELSVGIVELIDLSRDEVQVFNVRTCSTVVLTLEEAVEAA